MSDPNVIEMLEQIQNNLFMAHLNILLALIGIIVWMAVFSHKCKFKEFPDER